MTEEIITTENVSELFELRQQLSEAREELRQERLWKLEPDDHRDYLEARYKSVSHDLELAAKRERSKDARIAELESLAIQQDKRIDELMTAEGLAQAALNQVNDIAELTLARGDYQYGLGQIEGIAASALKGTEDA